MTCHKRVKVPQRVSKELFLRVFMKSCITLACGWEILLCFYSSLTASGTGSVGHRKRVGGNTFLVT